MSNSFCKSYIHVTHYYFINFVEGLIPRVSEAHCGYTSSHEYVITINAKSPGQGDPGNQGASLGPLPCGINGDPIPVCRGPNDG